MSELAPTPIFDKLWSLKSRFLTDAHNWYSYTVYATLTKDVVMEVWDGKHPPSEHMTEHLCKAGTKVIVWMVSRFGDVGITDNLINPNGYDARGINPDTDLKDFEFIEKVKT